MVLTKETIEKALSELNRLSEDRELFATKYEDAVDEIKTLKKELSYKDSKIKEYEFKIRLTESKSDVASTTIKELINLNDKLSCRIELLETLLESNNVNSKIKHMTLGESSKEKDIKNKKTIITKNKRSDVDLKEHIDLDTVEDSKAVRSINVNIRV